MKMKGIIVSLILACCFHCMSCTNKSLNEFQTPDLALFALKGKVKECRTYYFKAVEKDGNIIRGDSLGHYSKDILGYSATGEITFISDYGTLIDKGITVKKNSQGRITEIISESPWTEIEGGGTFTRGETWEYDAGGRPCRNVPYDDMEGQYADNRIEYDADNNICRFEDKGRYPCVTTYQYLEFDKHNNWTKRMATYQEILNEPQKQYEERKITYYE